MICGCTTYCPLVQKSVVELHKLLLGLFCIEVLEELGVKVAQLAVEERKQTFWGFLTFMNNVSFLYRQKCVLEI